MNTGKFVFSQVTDFVNKYEFNKCVKCYFGDYRSHELNSWNHFLQLLFGQMTGLHSINSICFCLKAHRKKLYHLGIRQFVNVSTLSRAGESRNWRIFADFGNYLIKIVRPLYAHTPVPNVDIDNEIFALDSTSISCSINLLTWAEGKYSRGAVKKHTIIDLRGCISTFIHITDGKYHDSNVLDVIDFLPNAIYLMDKHALKSNLSIYEIMQILGVSAFDKTPIRELLTQFQPNKNTTESQYILFDNV